MTNWFCLFVQILVHNVVFNANSERVDGIYRSTCVRSAQMKEDVDKKLVGTAQNVIAEKYTESPTVCITHCVSNERCMTINHKEKSLNNEINCQLLDISETNESAVLENVAGWTHFEPIANHGPSCQFEPCQPGFRCQENCSKPEGYECIGKDECASKPCQNGAICMIVRGEYRCKCKPGTIGANCQRVFSSCNDHYKFGVRKNGVYPIVGLSGTSFNVYCDMDIDGLTLAARFSNADEANWVQPSATYWYDTIELGSTVSPSDNADMINRAFHDVRAKNFIVTVQNPRGGLYPLFFAINCLSTTFRAKMTSYGDFRNNSPWLDTDNGCRGTCNIYTMKYSSMVPPKRRICYNDRTWLNETLGIWCHYGRYGNSAVLMIGGRSLACNGTSRGIGITKANTPNFDRNVGAKDFGDDSSKSSDALTTNPLNLWVY